ncbi:glyoxalase-like domain-containing protein [Tricladium varicosporioides]|nr:glyoxalase-like domain-containing protein [Hymenoscyphus varicosporioides]
MSLSLDHIIVLVSPEFLASPPTWLTKNFTLTPGGRHADGITENKLICFGDGAYIELIAFVSPPPSPDSRKNHWWGAKTENSIIDFAFTSHDSSTAGENWSSVQKRIKDNALKGIGYQRPVKGGRKRPDGVQVDWEVTFPVVAPDSGYERGELPFFCHDITPRELRVPIGKENTTHPCGAFSIGGLSVFTTEEKVEKLRKAFGAVLGVESIDGRAAARCLRSVEGEEVEREFEVKVKPLARTDVEGQLRENIGVLLGDLIIGLTLADKEQKLVKIDVGEGGEVGLGGWFTG